MSFAYLIFDRWLFVKRGNPGFKEETILEKARLGISRIKLMFKIGFLLGEKHIQRNL